MATTSDDRATRIGLHIRINTFRGVLSTDELHWSQIETAEIGLLQAEAERLRTEADAAIEAERARYWLQGPDWDE